MADPDRVDEDRHVLDHTGDAEVAPPGHVGHPNRHLLSSERGRGDDQHLGPGEEAGQCHLHVAGAWRHVDQQVVHVAPADLGEELLDGLRQHQPAPHDRGVLVVDDQAHRHDLDRAVSGTADTRDRPVGRIDLAVAATQAGLHAEHARDREAPDVGVEDADRETSGGQCDGQIAGDRRLAHAALPRPDGKDARAGLDLRVGRAVLSAKAGPLHHIAALGRGQLTEADVRLAHPAQGVEPLERVLLDLRLQRATGNRQRDDHLDIAGRGDVDAFDHAELDDVDVQLGVDHPAQHTAHIVGGRGCLHGRGRRCGAGLRAHDDMIPEFRRFRP